MADIKLFRIKDNQANEELPTIKLSLSKIQEIDEAGILYMDAEGNSANIPYYEAHKGWCKSKQMKRSKPKYICDRSYTNRELIFYTDSKLIFYAAPEQEALWLDVGQRITAQGLAIFDTTF